MISRLCLIVLIVAGCDEMGPGTAPPANQEKDQGVLMTVTAYCPCSKCCYPFADGITASGHKIQLGDRLIAAPPEIPFGTLMDIPGYGRCTVKDRGGSIKGNRLDVLFHSHQEALNWGVKYLKVVIYDFH